MWPNPHRLFPTKEINIDMLIPWNSTNRLSATHDLWQHEDEQ
jgi:hypothetical protein